VIDVSVGTRIVLVLGRGRLGLHPGRRVAQAGDHGVPIVLLAVGYPTTHAQQRFVSDAVDRAFELRVALEAEMVPELSGLTARLRSEDDVRVVAAGREARQIGSALASEPS
jgi:hypothetical protein